MRVDYSQTFNKQLQKAPVKIVIAFKNRLALYLQDPSSPQLRVHKLMGKYKGRKSISVTGDWRAIYRETKDGILFELLGMHSQLYS